MKIYLSLFCVLFFSKESIALKPYLYFISNESNQLTNTFSKYNQKNLINLSLTHQNYNINDLFLFENEIPTYFTHYETISKPNFTICKFEKIVKQSTSNHINIPINKYSFDNTINSYSLKEVNSINNFLVQENKFPEGVYDYENMVRVGHKYNRLGIGLLTIGIVPVFLITSTILIPKQTFNDLLFTENSTGKGNNLSKTLLNLNFLFIPPIIAGSILIYFGQKNLKIARQIKPFRYL